LDRQEIPTTRHIPSKIHISHHITRSEYNLTTLNPLMRNQHTDTNYSKEEDQSMECHHLGQAIYAVTEEQQVQAFRQAVVAEDRVATLRMEVEDEKSGEKKEAEQGKEEGRKDSGTMCPHRGNVDNRRLGLDIWSIDDGLDNSTHLSFRCQRTASAVRTQTLNHSIKPHRISNIHSHVVCQTPL